MYCRSSWLQVRSSGNSSSIARMTGMPTRCASTAQPHRYGISRFFSSANSRVTSTASSSNAQGTR